MHRCTTVQPTGRFQISKCTKVASANKPAFPNLLQLPIADYFIQQHNSKSETQISWAFI